MKILPAFFSTFLLLSGCMHNDEQQNKNIPPNKDITEMNEIQKIQIKTITDRPGFQRIIQFFDQNNQPVVNPPWGHEMREGMPDENGIVTISLYGIDGKPQHAEGHLGFCLPFVCQDHFNPREGLKIRLSSAPVIISVGAVAKMGLYGQLQRVYDCTGNELVLNSDPDGGYKLFLISPQKKVLQKYYLRDGNNLRNGPEGYAYVFYEYDAEGKRLSEKTYKAEEKSK